MSDSEDRERGSDMKHIQFSQEMAPDMRKPWSVIVNEQGEVVYGRPDAEYLIGFGPKGEYEITVLAKEAVDHPELTLGLRPVFQKGGEMFGVDLAVDECVPYLREQDIIDAMHARELEMRRALG